MAKQVEAAVPRPPKHLSKQSADLWAEVVSAGRWTGPRLAVLQAGLEALDRANAAREQIADRGLLVTTKRSGAQHVNPLLRLEASSRSQFLAVMEKLRLHFPPSGV